MSGGRPRHPLQTLHGRGNGRRARPTVTFGLDPVRDVQVLCPMNRGGLGARSLNLELQRVLNPPGEVRVERFGWTYAAGDKVMQVENDDEREVYNGDLGFIARIDPDAGEVAIDFEGREVAYDLGELDAVVPAYATTVHKAQGSEYPAVVIPLVTQHFTMLRRNLIYTAVTRGKKLVVIVGQAKALALAVRGAQMRRRWWSRLGEWLGGEGGGITCPNKPSWFERVPSRCGCPDRTSSSAAYDPDTEFLRQRAILPSP